MLLAAGFACLVLGLGAFLVHTLGKGVTEEFDRSLLAQARALAALCENEGDGIEFDYAPASMPQFERAHAPDYFQFWHSDGTPLLRSRQAMRMLQRQPAVQEPTVVWNVPLPDGRTGRAVQLSFTVEFLPDDEDESDPHASPSGVSVPPVGDAAATSGSPLPPIELILVVARGRERLDHLLGIVRWSVLGSGVLVILFSILLSWRLLVSGLAPLDEIADQVRGLDAENLDARVALDAPPRELAPVVKQLNALLGRLSASFERERRFAGNVAHELRTPIAELRSLATVAAKWPDDEAAQAAFFGDVGQIATRMEGVISDLLLLARCQAGVERIVPASLDLRQLVMETWRSLADRAAARGLRLEIDIPDGLVLRSDPSKLGIALANLLGNAVSYAHEGTSIECRAAGEGEGFALLICNAADPVPAADIAHLTEPFWRGDPARSSSQHAGLGLSLVAAIAKLLGLVLALEQNAAGRFCACLSGTEAAALPGSAPGDNRG